MYVYTYAHIRLTRVRQAGRQPSVRPQHVMYTDPCQDMRRQDAQGLHVGEEGGLVLGGQLPEADPCWFVCGWKDEAWGGNDVVICVVTCVPFFFFEDSIYSSFP